MTQSQRVPLPLGAGIDDRAEPFSAQPPLDAQAHNLVPDLVGGLQKPTGYASLGSALGDSHALVPGHRKTLHLSRTRTREVDGTNITTLAGWDPGAFDVEAVAVLAGAGHVRDVQAAHLDGYTCLVYCRLDGRRNATLTTPVASYRMEALVLGPNLDLVYGPVLLSDMRWLPRVEPLRSDGPGDRPQFAVFGVGFSDPLTVSSPNGLFGHRVDLYAARVGVGTVSAAVSLGRLWEPRTNVEPIGEDRVYKLYDTSSDPANGAAYAVWPRFHGDGLGEQSLAYTRVTASTETTSFFTGLTEQPRSLSALVHAATDTLVFARGNVVFTIRASDFTGLTGGTAAPVRGPDTTAGVLRGVDVGNRGHTHELWNPALQPSSTILFGDRPLLLVGSAPATAIAQPSLETSYLPHLFRPVTADGQTYYFACGAGAPKVSNLGGGGNLRHNFRGASSILLYREDEFAPHGRAPMGALYLLASRLGPHGHKAFVWDHPKSVDNGWTLPAVTGQAPVLDDGRIFVPAAWLTSLQNPRNSMRLVTRSLEDGNYFTTITATEGDETDGAGFFNDEQVVGGVLVRPSADRGAHVDIGRAATLVASGTSFMWHEESGALFPVALPAPQYRYVSYTPEGSPSITRFGGAERAVTPADVGVFDGSDLGFEGTEAKYDRSFRHALVLVATLPDGTEVRSEPWIHVSPTSLGFGEDDFPGYLPEVQIDLPHEALPFFLDPRASLDAEFYVTPRVFETDPPRTADSHELSALTMVCRMPVREDGAGFFILDTMQDLRYAWTVPGTPSGFMNPPHINGLYTATGELPPEVVPPFRELTHAGGYAFAVAAEDPYELWPSKPLVRGRVPEFSAVLTLQAPPGTGGVVSLGEAFDRLVLVCRNGVWELPVVDGPDALGAGSFPPFRRVTAERGGVNARGTVRTPAGLWYLSADGPCLFGGDGVQPLGLAVRDRLDWSAVTAAVYEETEDRVTWYTPDASVSVTRNTVWTTSSLGAGAACYQGGRILRVAEGTILRQDRAVNTDAGRPVNASWTSAWYSLGDLMGFRRTHDVGLLVRIFGEDGALPTEGSLRVGLAYDYEPEFTDEVDWTASELGDIGAGGRGVQLSVKPRRQKGTAIRVRVEDVSGGHPDEPSSDLRWSIVGAELRVRAKAGLGKTARENKR